MPRRKAAVKREVLPDPLFGSERLSRFINVVMREGKRSIAERIVYQALDEAGKRLSKKAKAHGKDAKDKKDDEEGGSGSTTATTTKKPAGSQSHDSLEILDRALNAIRPSVEVKSRRVGGATYQVPVEVDTERGIALAMRWLAKHANDRSEKTMILRLAAEMLEACEGRGSAVKQRDDMHRMAKANQAFAHYRW